MLTVENQIRMITKLFKSLIRPILEYGNLIWGPYYVANQQAIEGVQRRATKLRRAVEYNVGVQRRGVLILKYLEF